MTLAAKPVLDQPNRAVGVMALQAHDQRITGLSPMDVEWTGHRVAGWRHLHAAGILATRIHTVVVSTRSPDSIDKTGSCDPFVVW